MIKVNLLEGAADIRSQAKATKAAAKTTQQLLMIVGALVLLLGVLAFDYLYTSARLAEAERQLAEQKRISEELKENRKRKEQLERQIRAVKDRIKIIEDLQKTQRGPSAMLSVINQKLSPELIQLESIVQKGDEVTVNGVAKSEESVSDFARGIELGSDNLFQGVQFETTRRETAVKSPDDPEAEPRLVVEYLFNLKAKYTPTQVGQPAAAPGAAPGAAPAAAPAAPK